MTARTRTTGKMSLRHFGLAILAPLLLAGCGDSPVDPPGPAPVASVDLSAPSRLLVPGQAVQLQAELRDSAGNALTDRPVAWRSSDSTVARVSETGLVTAVSRGEATITAASGEASDTVLLAVVRAIRDYTVQGHGLALAVDASRQLSVRAWDSAGTEIPDPRVRWSSTDPSALAVSDSGEIRGVAPGIAHTVVQIENVTVQLKAVVVRGYSVVALGTLGGAGSRAFGIGEDGAVVGEAQTAAGEWHAFLWRGGEMTALGAPGRYSRAVAVNRSAEVVGIFRPGADNSGPTRPFLWSAGRTTELAPSSPAEHVFATDVNDRGEAVGYSTTTCSSCPRGTVGSAHLWKNGETTDLGRFGGHQGLAFAIDEAGRIAGGVQPQDSAVLLADGAVQRLFPGGASALSSAGHVVGSHHEHVYVWKDGQVTPLHMGRRASMTVRGVTARGEIVGNFSYYPGLSAYFAVIRREDGYILTLNEMLAPGTTWRLDAATGINDRGEIVGYGRESDTGPVRALLLRPRP